MDLGAVSSKREELPLSSIARGGNFFVSSPAAQAGQPYPRGRWPTGRSQAVASEEPEVKDRT